MRNLVATVAGIVAMIGGILVVEAAGHAVFPTGEGADMAAMVAAMPPGARLVVVFGWMLGPLVGAFVAARMTGWIWAPRIVAALAILAGLATVIAIPHPWWMVLASVLAPLAGFGIGTRLAARPAP